MEDKYAALFAEWLNRNRWLNYEEDVKKWCYTFEGGTAISKKSYEKNYMKTTQELIEMFKASYDFKKLEDNSNNEQK